MKTKCVAGVDLGSDCFAFVGDPEKPEKWKLPIYFRGNESLTRNHIKNAVERFASTKIPDEQRAETWRLIAGAAKAHGIRMGQQPAPAYPKPEQPLLDAEDVELKQARAVGELAAERFLKQIGY